MDEFDRAAESELRDRERALAIRKQVLRPCGGCHSCGEPLEDNRLFCDQYCRDDYEARQSAKERNGT
ncbi:MAG: hypothetical protein ACYC0M_15350 [Burkholderiales bacterium]